jgi:ketosteroid isomerase-like protein
MEALLVPIVGMVRVDRYDMVDPTVQEVGNAALLTFNLVSYQTDSDGIERAVARWNASQLYALSDGRWQLIHSHWSYTQPELIQPAPEGA